MTNPNPPTQPRPTMQLTAVEAYFAEAACNQPAVTNPSDHARNAYITRPLNHEFKERFGMSDAAAKAAVAEEMRRRYSPNPWDAPGPRRPRPQRRTPAAKEEKVDERSEEGRKAEGYSEEQWDLFERQLGYK